MISADFLSAVSLTLASNLLGQRLDLFLAGSTSSSVRILSVCSTSACLLASRRILRIEMRASSARSLTRLASFLRCSTESGRHVQADDLAVGVGRQAQVAGLDRLDDVADDRRIERSNQDLLRFGRAQVGHLLERRRASRNSRRGSNRPGRRSPGRSGCRATGRSATSRSFPSALPPRARSLRCSWVHLSLANTVNPPCL